MEETKKIRTVCGYCGTGCGLILEVENNKIVKSRGDKEAPVNQGQTCIKGWLWFWICSCGKSSDFSSHSQSWKACGNYMGRGL